MHYVRLNVRLPVEQRNAAIALHASQRSPYDGLPEDLRRDFLTTEHLQKVRPGS